jgi:hypothetical protein
MVNPALGIDALFISAIVLSVILRFTVSDYLFGIFKFVLQ